MKQPTQQSDFRILLVEDDPGDVELIQILLSEEESWVATLNKASTLSEGIALVQEDQEIDVVLLDLSLPDEYGLETFRQLHNEFPLLPEDAIELLQIYQQIWRQGAIWAISDSPQQRQLLLSGLVFRQQGKLQVSNPIYRAIFNPSWIERQLVRLNSNTMSTEPRLT